MSEGCPIVFVVDDDMAVRRGLERLLRSAGYQVQTFGSADEFLRASVPDGPGCLVLDVRMPGQTGLELQETLARRGCALPIIFITGHGDIPVAVRAMKKGAVDFLPKPFDVEDLFDAIRQAVARSA